MRSSPALEALSFSYSDTTTKIAEAIVTPPLVIEFRIGTFIQLFDQTVTQHPLDGSVERAWTKTHFPFTALVNLAHDVVTMPFFVRERQQDVKHCRRQRQPGFRTSL